MNTDSSRINRRHFLHRFGALSAGTLLVPGILGKMQVMASQQASFRVKLADLPYAANALEPYIDQATMEIHHGRHHAAYVRGVNQVLDHWTDCPFSSLESVFTNMGEVPEAYLTSFRNNGGGAWNHELFWELMSPDPTVPRGRLLEAVQQNFGSVEAMKNSFRQAALGRFGSGWAWLCVDKDGSLFITSTPNQDNPLMKGLVDRVGTPILGLDVWEHAYYLHYQNRRGDYVDAFWNVVNWRKAEFLFESATSI